MMRSSRRCSLERCIRIVCAILILTYAVFFFIDTIQSRKSFANDSDSSAKVATDSSNSDIVKWIPSAQEAQASADDQAASAHDPATPNSAPKVPPVSFTVDAEESLDPEPENRPEGSSGTTKIKDVAETSTFSEYNMVEDDSETKNTVPNETSEKSDSTPKEYSSPWTWTCGKDRKCYRKEKVSGERHLSLESCFLTCGQLETLWPKPGPNEGKNVVGREAMHFLLKNLVLKSVKVGERDKDRSEAVQRLGSKAFAIFKQNVNLMLPKGFKNPAETQDLKIVSVSLRISTAESRLSLLTNEAYQLEISEKEQPENDLRVSITGRTFFGVRHGLETLSQLIVFDEVANSLQILKKVKLRDGPAFPYRGLMIDTARNFIPIPALRRMVTGMGQNKLNVLHWHITDANSFPLYCPSFPQMTDYGAHSKDEIYYPEEVKEFVQYALLRGVKVIPELDAPAHAGNGWQWGSQENGFGQLALCVNDYPYNEKSGQPPPGQLNPANPKLYEVLRGLYHDILSMFDTDMFHMGGDEVLFTCWDTKEIEDFMSENRINSYNDLRIHFQSHAYEMLKMAAKNHSNGPIPILWTSDLTKALPKLQDKRISPTEYIIQSWEGNARALFDADYPLIVSDVGNFYLDLGAGSWLGKNHNWQYINWQTIYRYNFREHGYHTDKTVLNSVLGEIPQILGAEATLWTEKVNEWTMDAKLWPRGAALAERLWLNPGLTETKSPLVYSRILRQNERMKQRGIRVDTRQPRSCILISGNCENRNDREP